MKTMAKEEISVERGSVNFQVHGLELLNQYSLASFRKTNTSKLSIVGEIILDRYNNDATNRPYSEDQIIQGNFETLYGKYEHSLRVGCLKLCTLFIVAICSSNLIITAINTTYDLYWYLFLIYGLYALNCVVTITLLTTRVYRFVCHHYKWGRNAISIIIITLLTLTDVLSTVLDSKLQPLRQSFLTPLLLIIYVFLPFSNNYMTFASGFLVSLNSIILTSCVSLIGVETIVYQIIAVTIFAIGVNSMGIYFRLMNEIVTRKSFLDRRACVEAKTKLNYEREQEERLLASILPEHLTNILKSDIRNVILHRQSRPNFPMKRTSQMYIEEHKNVSILYADIVNYTTITTTLQPIKLVELLNDLFCKFDDAAQEHSVCRIKFLGDCYYCVVGIPEPLEDHAYKAVEFGFEMIAIISAVRKNQGLNIDMRIGVHSGRIISGIIGIRKWQYDIWSKDVTIANRMESTGKAGKVHITKKTLFNLGLRASDYLITPNLDARKDPILSQYQIDTFFLSKQPNEVQYEEFRYKRLPLENNRSTLGVKTRRTTTMGRISTSFMENNILAFQKMVYEADMQMEKEIEMISEGHMHSAVLQSDLNETFSEYTLRFNSTHLEGEFARVSDPHFKYFLTLSLCISVLIVTIHLIVAPGYNNSIAARTYSGLLIAIVLFHPFAWTHTIWYHFNRNQPTNALLKFLVFTSNNITENANVRIAMHIIVVFTMPLFTMSNLIRNYYQYQGQIAAPWEIIEIWILMLLLSFLYCRIYFVIKWIIGILITSSYLWLIWDGSNEIHALNAAYHTGTPYKISFTVLIILLTVVLLLIDRKSEYSNRLDFLWRLRLLKEKEEAETLFRVNNILLENILPSHVANIYLNTNRITNKLYYEKYDCVAVMFASLTNNQFGCLGPNDTPEITLLGVLEQIISDFDRVLINNEIGDFSIEKIKMAGWTYMAACGLKSKGHDAVIKDSKQYEMDIVLTMMRFAASIMMQLKLFNRRAFQNYNLRIGISHGEVTAGVVGASKPLYDIWGHAVNMASRMDSTGIEGKIQVTDRTALEVERSGFLTDYRGQVPVKGAGIVDTYFIPLNKEYDLVKDLVKEKISIKL